MNLTKEQRKLLLDLHNLLLGYACTTGIGPITQRGVREVQRELEAWLDADAQEEST